MIFHDLFAALVLIYLFCEVDTDDCMFFTLLCLLSLFSVFSGHNIVIRFT